MEASDTIIFTLARMNPPTPGHLHLIQKLIETAINKNVNDVYIILSKTNDDNENPIPCPEKIEVLGGLDNTTKTMIQSLKEMMINETNDLALKDKISNIRVNAICVPEVKGATPFTPLLTLVENNTSPEINLFLIIGDDRKKMADSITNVFFKLDNVKSIDAMILPREEMTEFKERSKNPELLEELTISEVPINAMSASFVRNIVKNERKDKFMELYAPYLDEGKIDKLYEDIHNGITTLGPTNKRDVPEEPLIYNYPMIKGISEFPIKRKREPAVSVSSKKGRSKGGRTNKRRKRKSRKIRKGGKNRKSRKNKI